MKECIHPSLPWVPEIRHMLASQHIQELQEVFLKIKMLYLLVNKKKNHLLVRGWDRKMSLMITVCHHLASLVMPISNPRHRFFYTTLTLMVDSYILGLNRVFEISI